MKEMKTMKKIKLGDIICNGEGGFTDPFLVPSDINYLEVSSSYWFRGREVSSAILNDAHIKTLFSNYIMPSLYDKTVSLANEWSDEDTVYSNNERMFRKILAWCMRTREYHNKVIDACENLDLMKEVKATTRNYFNDTPQSPDPDLDTHITNYTKSESSNELATPASRIEEIRRLYQDEYQNWYNEFYQSFIMIL